MGWRCAVINAVAAAAADVLFLETSALTGEGVTDVFVRVARLILSKIEDGWAVHAAQYFRISRRLQEQQQ